LAGSVELVRQKLKRSLDNRVNVKSPFIPADIPLPEFRSIKQILKNNQRPSSSTELSTIVTLPSLPPLSEVEIAADLKGITSGRRSNHQRLYQQMRHQEQQRQQQHHPPILPHITYHSLDPFAAAMGGEYGIIDGSQYACDHCDRGRDWPPSCRDRYDGVNRDSGRQSDEPWRRIPALPPSEHASHSPPFLVLRSRANGERVILEEYSAVTWSVLKVSSPSAA